jgi:hypothetical protein
LDRRQLLLTAGAIRTVHGGLEDALSLVEPVEAARAEATELAPCTAEGRRADMLRLTEGRCDAELLDLLVTPATR